VNVLALLILASLAMATIFLVGFIWAVRSGQYEDTCTPSMRLLVDEPPVSRSKTNLPIKPDQQNS
jgi:cbb3-type cytochrome oxidase maturation protein